MSTVDSVMTRNVFLDLLSKTCEFTRSISEVAASLLGEFMYRKNSRIWKIEISSNEGDTSMINDKELLEIIAKDLVSFNSLFPKDYPYKVLILDGGNYNQYHLDSIFEIEMFKNGLSARLYSVF